MNRLNIYPFNDVWYGNCFMHTILPILEYYGINIRHFLKDDTLLYYDFKNSINLGLEKVQNLDHYLSQLGYKIKYFDMENIIEVIIGFLDRSIPVIVWIDCFYVTRRKDTFNKNHLAHCILIYGYDLKKLEFIILDHDHENSLQFGEKRISFFECEVGMQKYKEFYSRNFCLGILKKEEGVVSKEFEKDENRKKFFWNIIENYIYDLKEDNLETLMIFFGNYERMLKALMYANEEDYKMQIKNVSILKVLLGKGIYTSDIFKIKEKILKLYESIHIQ